jgi:predicted component of viral defense system (DUF524 family)
MMSGRIGGGKKGIGRAAFLDGFSGAVQTVDGNDYVADLYKMHTYRDAISSARSVWIVYPGSDFCFFDEAHGRISELDQLVVPAEGVGAIPVLPGEKGDVIERMVGRMVMG